MDEGFFPSPRREEGANQDSQPTSNTGIGKKTRPPPSADWLNLPSFPQNQKIPSVRRTTLESSEQAATRGLQAAGGAPWSADKLLSHVEILPYS